MEQVLLTSTGAALLSLVVVAVEMIVLLLPLNGVQFVKAQWFIVPLLTGLCLVSTRYLSAQELQSRLKTSTRSQDETSTPFVFHAGTGLGLFQDIQVPASTTEGLRADGTNLGEANANHLGSTLYFGGMMRWGQVGRLSYDFELDYLTMRAISGPAETQSSSYSRFNMMGGSRYAWGSGNWRPMITLHAGLRRSLFNNVSTGHYLNAAFVRGGVGLWNSDFSIDTFVSYAPFCEFGFNSGKSFFGGEALKSGSTNLSEIGLLYSQRVSEAVWLDLGLEQELLQTRGARGEDYSGFGLNVDSTDAGPRDLNLATIIGRFGFRKQF